MMRSSYKTYLGIQYLFFIFVHSQQLCPPPDVPRYGDYFPKKSNFQPGDKVTYNCTEMHTLMGKDTSRCKSNGDWSNPPPFCDMKADIKSPYIIRTQGWRIPSLYINDGNTSTCASFKTGESITMTIEKTGSIHAVRMFLERGDINMEIISGSATCVVYYKYVESNQWVLLRCNRNIPVPNSVRLQSKSDKMNNNTICEIEVYVKEEESCDVPPDRRVANGYFEVTRTLAKLNCEDGYQTESGNDRLVCEKKVWVGSKLQCDEILCSPVINIAVTPGSEWTFLDSVKKISAGTRRRLKCLDGYIKDGSPDTVVCQKNGLWTNTNATCVEVEKAKIKTIIIGVVSGIVVLIIVSLFITTIYFVKKQRREVVVVYNNPTDGSVISGSEPEYASVYYETIKGTAAQPQPPTSSRPMPQLITEGYFSPLDSQDSLKKQPTPVDLAFGTLKQSSLYR